MRCSWGVISGQVICLVVDEGMEIWIGSLWEPGEEDHVHLKATMPLALARDCPPYPELGHCIGSRIPTLWSGSSVSSNPSEQYDAYKTKPTPRVERWGTPPPRGSMIIPAKCTYRSCIAYTTVCIRQVVLGHSWHVGRYTVGKARQRQDTTQITQAMKCVDTRAFLIWFLTRVIIPDCYQLPCLQG